MVKSFKLRTDHASLVWLYKRSEPSHQVARWIEVLSEFDFTIEHRAGAKHGNADGLSRCQDCKQCSRIEERDGGPTMGELGDLGENRVATLRLGNSRADSELREAQSTPGSELNSIKAHVNEQTTPCPKDIELGSDEFRRLAKLIPHMRVHEELLQLRTPDPDRDRWVNLCPRTLRSAVIWDTHGQHHAGISKTTKRVSMDWYWPGIHRDIARLLQSCEVCQAAKTSRTCNSQHRQRLHAGRPWQVLSIDLMGPLSETDRGNNVVLVMTDHFTRWRDAIPLPNGTAPVVAEAPRDQSVLLLWYTRADPFGSRGSIRVETLWRVVCTLGYRQEQDNSLPSTGKWNGRKRSNRDLGNALRALLLGGREEDWDLLLPHIMRSFRATPHSSTGETANFLMMGREARLPDQLLHGRSLEEDVSREAYAVALGERLYIAYEKLRTQEQRVRHADSREVPLIQKGRSCLAALQEGS